MYDAQRLRKRFLLEQFFKRSQPSLITGTAAFTFIGFGLPWLALIAAMFMIVNWPPSTEEARRFLCLRGYAIIAAAEIINQDRPIDEAVSSAAYHADLCFDTILDVFSPVSEATIQEILDYHLEFAFEYVINNGSNNLNC